jgi:hypothetical protein
MLSMLHIPPQVVLLRQVSNSKRWMIGFCINCIMIVIGIWIKISRPGMVHVAISTLVREYNLHLKVWILLSYLLLAHYHVG